MYHHCMCCFALSRCIIDSAPRTFDAKSCSVLANMAEMVVREIEREKVLAVQLAANSSKDHEALLRAIDSYRYVVLRQEVQANKGSNLPACCLQLMVLCALVHHTADKK